MAYRSEHETWLDELNAKPRQTRAAPTWIVLPVLVAFFAMILVLGACLIH